MGFHAYWAAPFHQIGKFNEKVLEVRALLLVFLAQRKDFFELIETKQGNYHAVARIPELCVLAMEIRPQGFVFPMERRFDRFLLNLPRYGRKYLFA